VSGSSISSSLRSRHILLLAGVLLAVVAAYANHFQNGFHFDDSHAVVDNPYIRSLHNLRAFFTDASTFSVLPANRTYRPFVSLSLAVDYALGRGYKPFWFHLSTFIVFLFQLVAMAALFISILDSVRPEPEDRSANRYVSIVATAWYGLHPAIAETVNYIIQRGDIFCTVGVVAALAIFARWPKLRKTGFYLVPFAFALLSKPPAAVFPLLLFLYIAMFEREDKACYGRAAILTIPSLLLCALLMALQAAMTPKSYTPSTLSAYSYCITQPFVLMRYFGSLFLPLHLNVDSDLQPFATFSASALFGFLFVALLLIAAWFTARRGVLRPISYGLLWFLISSSPTSVYRLSEVENDHRMYLPFVGLVLAVVWACFLTVKKAVARTHPAVAWRVVSVAVVLLLALYGYGAHLRNRVWRTDESLWLDDVLKCPRNGRGLMNYGLTQMAKGEYPAALEYFQRALVYTPNYKTLEINLGVVYGAMNQGAEAEQHFLRAIALAPTDDEAHYYYGRWLYQSGRLADAIGQLRAAVQLNPARLAAHDTLAVAYLTLGDAANAHAVAAETLRLAPADASAAAMLAHPVTQDANYWINASLYQYRSGNYEACIASANQALKLKPDSEVAYNNRGAAYAALRQWNLAIESERAALRISPGFALSKNNLALYEREKNGKSAPEALPAAHMTAADWLIASMRANQAGEYQQSIDDARAALKLRPDYPEAYNNIAAAYEAMHKWDDAIAAAKEAIRLKPDFQLAKNNLEWSISQQKLGVR
jgi:tetratricopeptide (TPR) repeat protein